MNVMRMTNWILEDRMGLFWAYLDGHPLLWYRTQKEELLRNWRELFLKFHSFFTKFVQRMNSSSKRPRSNPPEDALIAGIYDDYMPPGVANATLKMNFMPGMGLGENQQGPPSFNIDAGQNHRAGLGYVPDKACTKNEKNLLKTFVKSGAVSYEGDEEMVEIDRVRFPSFEIFNDVVDFKKSEDFPFLLKQEGQEVESKDVPMEGANCTRVILGTPILATANAYRPPDFLTVKRRIPKEKQQVHSKIPLDVLRSKISDASFPPSKMPA
ncbi:hypothetical protein M5689_011106 [Euphorbia peplus]|nr:hypothetical protein M5689_011106 [Euphorbia peplus]